MSHTKPTDTEIANTLSSQNMAGELYTPPSTQIGSFDLSRAYELQRAYVAHWQTRDSIGGFKAAVTAPPMQKAFGLPGPVTSVLFSEGACSNNCSFPLADYRTLLVETELSFRLKESLSSPLDTIDDLGSLVARCSPTFELADPGFGKAKFTGEDLVATNIACRSWIEGDAFDWQSADLDKLSVTLKRNGETLHTESAGSVMDGQWHALLWLINESIAKGYTITPDHVLLTGAIGAAHPGQPGHYEADYGSAGRIEFQVS